MTIRFCDVSHFQAGMSLNGQPAAIAKATQGTSYVDPAFADFRSQAAALGIPFAAYHWIDTSDIAAQARHAVQVAGGLPLMWDCEAAGVTVPRIVSATNTARAADGNPRLVYLPRWYWSGHMGSPSLSPLLDAGLSLISSSYTTYSDTGVGWLPYGGMTPVQWQYTDTPIDMNAFKGTVDDLRRLWGLEDEMSATLLLAYDAGNVVWMGDGITRRVVGHRSLDASAHPQWSTEIDWIGNWWGQKAAATLAGTDTPRGLLIPGPWGAELDGILGIDVATLGGGGASALVAHTHGVNASTTGPAVAS